MSLVILFNKILHSGKFPSKWRTSILTPIHKKGDKNNPGNYRGIAVNSNLCKLFCSILATRLSNFAFKNNLIPDEQIGFRKGFRTSDHILTLKYIIIIKLYDRYKINFVSDKSQPFFTISQNDNNIELLNQYFHKLYGFL